MAKKKKSALPAVSRGFATTSIAKKIQPAVDVPDQDKAGEDLVPGADPASNGAGGEGGTSDGAASSGAGDEGKKVAEEEDWEKEEGYLQGLVDKLQDKVDKEIARTLKTIDFEKRQAKGFSSLDITEEARNRALEMALEDDAEAVNTSTIPQSDADKVLSRLAITYGVLLKLGFSKERVEECLKALGTSWDLEDAFDWLYLHCSEDEILLQGDWSVKETTPVVPTTPATPFPPSRPRTPPHLGTPLASPTLESTPARALALPPAQTDIKRALFASADGDESSSDEEEILPATEYAKLRIKLDAIIGTPAPKGKVKGAKKNAKPKPAMVTVEPEEAKKIRKRMEVIKAMYLFQKDDAETEYKTMKDNLEAVELKARLRGDPLPVTTNGVNGSPPANDDGAPPAPLMDLQPSLPIESKLDSILDLPDENEDGPDGLSALFEQTELAEPASNEPPLPVRSLPLPKHYTASTAAPKTTLQAVAIKLDRFCLIDYTTLSASFRAARVKLKIRWSDKREQVWAMEDLGCSNMAEAECYVATLALHAIIAVEGKGDKGVWRSFPPAYRDLWDELEDKRKSSLDKERRAVWSTLRAIVEAKFAPPPQPEVLPEPPLKVPSSKLIPGFDFFPPAPKLENTNVVDPVSLQLQQEFARRQATPAYQRMMEQRDTLPIAAYREKITSSLETSQILVLSGETGCGKSTQLPSYILEDQLSRGKPCRIYVTEPRRISAISLAQRVSQELGDAPNQVGSMSSMVGYSIRLENCTSRNTRLNFVTNGIALRMLESGSGGNGGKSTAFDEITHIIVDEVHERSIESDFLLIVLKTLLEQRKDLKVVLMSATVDAEKISAFFGGCPTLSVPGRTFPVNRFFLEDAIEFSKWFINADSPYARRYGKFQNKKTAIDWNEDVMVPDDEDDDDAKSQAGAPVKLEKKYGAKTVATVNILDERLIPYDLIIRLLERLCFEDPAYAQYSASVLIFMPGLNEIRRLNDMLQEHPAFGTADFIVFPLHSSVSSEGQSAVFNTPPPGVRKIVIATNIAETGVTIPDCVCVIDSGKHREMRFDEKRQISKLVETWVAKSNAAQRRGRAGRVQEGLAFHLFTKLRHETQMQDHPLPEMLRLSLQDLALRIKILKVKMGGTIEEVLSKALDPPLALNIQRAVSSLVEVKALTINEDITPMGRLLSKLPMDVHLGKFLLTAALFRCLDPALTIAATLNAKSPFVAPFGFEHEADRIKLTFKTDNSDFMTIHNAFSSWRRASANPAFVRQFCRKNFLSHQNLQQIEELRQQLYSYLVDSGFIAVTDEQKAMISRARYSRRGPRFVSIPAAYDVNSEDPHMISAALATGLFPKVLSIDPSSGQLRTFSNNQPASIHPSSVNFKIKPVDRAQEFGTNHLAFFTIMHSKKLYAWETCPVDDRALILLCGDSEFRLASSFIQLDRKLKFQSSPKTMIALKHIRSQLASIFNTRMRGKEISDKQAEWWKLALEVLGKEADKEDTLEVVGGNSSQGK